MEVCMEKSHSRLGPYKSRQSLGKAVKKIKDALPSSTRKEAAAITQLIRDEIPFVEDRLKLLSVRSGASSHSDLHSLADETVTNIIEYYSSDSYLWQSPMRKDTMFVKNDKTGKRSRIAKRSLVMSVSELFQSFCQAYPGAKVKREKFFELRPKHVFPRSETPHHVCTCIYHENSSYLLDCLSKDTNSFPSEIREFLEQVTCDIPRSIEYIVVSSDYQSQDKFAVSHYMMLITLDIKEKHPEIDLAEVFSDADGSQFKNKFTQSNVVYAPEDSRMMVNWNFSCTSHEEGAVDGMRAVVKQSLWSAIKSRKYIFQSACDCHIYTTEKISGVKTFYAEEHRILTYEKILEKRWEKIRPIPHIKSMHSLEFSQPNPLKLKVHRNSNNYKQQSVLEVPPKSAGRLRVSDVYTDSEDNNPAGVSDKILSAEACNSKLAQPTIRSHARIFRPIAQ
ncbi:hypothetical protein QAD02_014056 [Eretmocerus hayati]|uniref:Uncharacterized protein n=1 Tax=Eretmocerus hayati TaxID=131215 RepID=A0ACC2P4M4_9HYME|nr:hypothetical protein QAD02_014056 [Eretmocerus hayati]